MAADAAPVRAPNPLEAYPDLILLALAVLSAALVPIRIGDVYDGLPAHPLFLHVPVVLIPLVSVAAVALALRARWLARYGLLLALVAVIALVGTILTAGAGEALLSQQNAQTAGFARQPGLGGNGNGGQTGTKPRAGGFAGGFGNRNDYVSQHAHAAKILRLLMYAFGILVVLLVIADRVGRGLTRVGALEGLVRRRATGMVLRAAVVVLSVACFVMVIHVGDLGAKAVWANRNGGGQAGPGFGGGGGFAPTQTTTSP